MGLFNQNRSRRAHANPFLRGILYGLAFFLPGMIIIKNADQILPFFDKFNQEPIIQQISSDFQTGFEVAGELFQQRSELFYQKDTFSIWSEKEVPVQRIQADYIWDRDEVSKKLEQAFGKRKMKAAQRFLDYIESHRDLAAYEMAHNRIPISIKLAQGLLESDAGKSYLARNTNNHFGIKCPQRRGYLKDGVINDQDFSHHRIAIDCFQQADDDEWDRFEVYRSIPDSYRRHSVLLTQSKRYNWMIDSYHITQHYEISKKWFGQSRVPYYAAWAAGLKESGYATSKRYAQKLAYLIETYELWRLDYELVIAIPES